MFCISVPKIMTIRFMSYNIVAKGWKDGRTDGGTDGKTEIIEVGVPPKK